MTRFVSGATTLQFNCDPVRPGGEKPQLQQAARDAAGELYVYSKSSLQRRLHRLHFARIDAATRAALLGFMRDTAQGTKYSFTWTDHLDVARTVRFATGKLRITPVGPTHYAVDISLQEDQ